MLAENGGNLLGDGASIEPKRVRRDASPHFDQFGQNAGTIVEHFLLTTLTRGTDPVPRFRDGCRHPKLMYIFQRKRNAKIAYPVVTRGGKEHNSQQKIGIGKFKNT